MKSITPSDVRVRFAPSPTGPLHLGGIHTALFSWAYARHYKGKFILRIEDTDTERSTAQAVRAILDSMSWLGLSFDEGPFFQTQRIERYRYIVDKMLKEGTAYHCYCSREDVARMRDLAKKRGEKPRYDGTCRPSNNKKPRSITKNCRPTIRFKNPLGGTTSWNDMVKGKITFSNTELDDCVIFRSDGMPTYNFCASVDDWDMKITHVIRGDDHINNTPRQINILRALKTPLPIYGHLPTILGPSGVKLSKRHGAASMMEYDSQGYLPEAIINYLARLGWSHHNEELFTRQQFIAWFNGKHLSTSPSQWDLRKLRWTNAHHLRRMSNSLLAEKITPRIIHRGGSTLSVDLPAVVDLFKERAETLEQLAENAMLFCRTLFIPASNTSLEEVLSTNIRSALVDFVKQADGIAWNRESIAALIKKILTEHKLGMSQFAIPLRLIVTGQAQTPNISATLALISKDIVINRIKAV